MRLLALLSDGFGAPGGIARFNEGFLRALAASSTVSAITALPRFGNARMRQIPEKVVQLEPRGQRLDYVIRAAALGLSGGRYNAVFCGHLYTAPLAASIAWAMRVPLWVQVHGIEAWARPSGPVRAAVERASLVTAVSRYTRLRLLDWADIEPSSAKVLSGTVEARFVPGPKPEQLIARHGLGGRKIILTISRLAATERYKGHDRVIRSLPKVLDSIPSAIYVVVGEGDDRARLEALAGSAGVAAAVRFLGPAREEELPELFRMADVFVMPSTGEGFGIVFLEAVAAGIPVIAGNRDGSVDALAEGALGTLVDPDDEGSLVRAIIASLTGRPPPDRATDRRFSFDNFCRQVDALVQHLR